MATPSEYLDPRGKIAMARVMLGIDPKIAQRFAADAFREVVELAFSTENLDHHLSAPAPWPIRCEPALVVAYCESLELARRQAEADARYDAASAVHRAEREQRQAQETASKVAFEAEVPTAQALLLKLQGGEGIELRGHSLEWDDEFECLAGTNAYGLDYYYGSMTLNSVESWRSRLLAGEDLGDCPPGSDGPYDDDDVRDGYENYQRHEQATEDILESVDDLRWGQVWKFDDSLQLITRTGFRTGLRAA